MRIGIFISGQVRREKEDVQRSIRLLEDAFPNAEFVYGTWETECISYLEELPNWKNLRVYREFDIDYEPFLDNPDAVDDYQYYKKLNNPNPPRHRHQTKQILMHNWLMKEFGHKFDVIIRSRWDVTISPFVDFMSLAKECNELPAIISVQQRTQYKRSMLHLYNRVPWTEGLMSHHTEKGKLYLTKFAKSCMVMDAGVILHRSIDWNSNIVDDLHNRKKLLAAEFGWHQVLVQGTAHHQWVHYDGGASLTRTCPKEEREIIREMTK